jgi:hypothetical protein
MGSKQKQTQAVQRDQFKRRLEERLSLLSEKGIEPSKIEKDTLVKKLRANLRAINVRLNTIAEYEKRTEELARIKVERAAAPRKDQEVAEEKEPKKVPKEGKVKTKKKE